MKILLHPVSSKNILQLSILTSALTLAGCTLRQSYPETQIRGYIHGQPFTVEAPKDCTLTGFDAFADTNGSVHVHIDQLKASLNPTNIQNAAEGQSAIVTATGQVISQTFDQAFKAATQSVSR